MTGFLLDSKVISELTRDAPDPHVLTFLSEHEDLWLPAILIHEVEYGLRLLPQGRRRSQLAEMQSTILRAYEDRKLPLDRMGAEWATEFRAQTRHSGRSINMGDALMAETAKAHDLAVATRNVAGFEFLEVELVNPWDSP